MTQRRPSGYRQPPDWHKTHARIIARDPHCRIAGVSCTRTSTTVDHVRPVAEGGSHDDDNLAGVCASCHADKTELERQRGIARRSRRRPARPDRRDRR